jgi:hypothetical protein
VVAASTCPLLLAKGRSGSLRAHRSGTRGSYDRRGSQWPGVPGAPSGARVNIFGGGIARVVREAQPRRHAAGRCPDDDVRSCLRTVAEAVGDHAAHPREAQARRCHVRAAHSYDEIGTRDVPGTVGRRAGHHRAADREPGARAWSTRRGHDAVGRVNRNGAVTHDPAGAPPGSNSHGSWHVQPRIDHIGPDQPSVWRLRAGGGGPVLHRLRHSRERGGADDEHQRRGDEPRAMSADLLVPGLVPHVQQERPAGVLIHITGASADRYGFGGPWSHSRGTASLSLAEDVDCVEAALRSVRERGQRAAAAVARRPQRERPPPPARRLLVLLTAGV